MDEEETKKWTHVAPATAALIMSWHGGQAIVAYSIGSRWYAGQWTWDKSGTRPLMSLTESEREEIRRIAQLELEREDDRSGERDEDAYSAAFDIVNGGEDALDNIGDGPER